MEASNKNDVLEELTLMAAKELYGMHEVCMKSRGPPHSRCPGALLSTTTAAAIPRSRCASR